jgi:hypothetical protein
LTIPISLGNIESASVATLRRLIGFLPEWGQEWGLVRVLDFASAVRIRHVILIFGLLNASLYSGLLPLWEGFDEAFHYSYVETLWQTHRLPVLGRTLLPEDVHRSFEFAPVGPIVHISTPQATSYDEWVSLPLAEKERRRKELGLLRPSPEDSSQPNYEAHQAPLAYIVLAVLDQSLSAEPITVRVTALRIFAAVLSTVLFYFGATALFRALQMPERYANAALYTIFCSEMLYATVAHVANDWLAVGLSAMFLASLADFVRKPDKRSALRSSLSTAAWLAAGLLTKAYFLAFGLLAFGTAAILVWRKQARVRTVLAGALLVLVAAGPWYARNLVLYKNVSGSYEEFAGVGVRQAIAAAPRIDWLATAGFLARGSLWTGNNSFGSFSRNTLNVLLVLVFTGLAAWGVRRRAIPAAEQITFAAVVIFSIAVAYASCANFVRTNGDVSYAGPWYTQVLLAPAIGLAYLGLSRWQRFGAVLAGFTVALWSWALIATWIVKLFPLYSGGGASPMRMRGVWNWWAHGAVAHAHDLSLLALAPASWLYAGLVVSVALCLLLGSAVIRSLSSWAEERV